MQSDFLQNLITSRLARLVLSTRMRSWRKNQVNIIQFIFLSHYEPLLSVVTVLEHLVNKQFRTLHVQRVSNFFTGTTLLTKVVFQHSSRIAFVLSVRKVSVFKINGTQNIHSPHFLYFARKTICDPPGRYTPQAGTPPGSGACWEIRATSGRYVSYWNAFLFKEIILHKFSMPSQNICVSGEMPKRVNTVSLSYVKCLIVCFFRRSKVTSAISLNK